MLEKIQEYINSGTNIFNPQAKIIANIDNVMEFLETKNTVINFLSPFSQFDAYMKH